MRWLITGAGGMLGREVTASLRSAGASGPDLVALDRAGLDITDTDAVHAAIGRYRPDVVVNCAAFTAVDQAEAREAEATRVNGDGSAYLAAACGAWSARLIHVSTDYVFRGDARTPYFEDDPPGPRTAYGRSKLVGERAVLGRLPNAAVVRTAWLYGSHGHNFVRTMLGAAERGESVDVVDDQVGSPTWAAEVADRIVELGLRPDAGGVFHAVNAGQASWFQFATEIFRIAGADPARVRAIRTRSLPARTPRPAYTVLGHRRWRDMGIGPPGDWRSALRAALPGIRP